MSDSGLQIDNLRLKGLTLSHLHLAPGDCVSLAGPSGAGKTLLLRALADLVPAEGDIRLDGQAVTAMKAHRWRRRVIWLPAADSWWAPRIRDHFPEPVDTAELEALALSPALLDRVPEQLSSGQRQRLAFLRALARQPRVLLLDEPTANLDEANALRLDDRLQRWLADGGMALVATHDPAQRQRLAGRHYRVENGLVWETT